MEKECRKVWQRSGASYLWWGEESDGIKGKWGRSHCCQRIKREKASALCSIMKEVERGGGGGVVEVEERW